MPFEQTVALRVSHDGVREMTGTSRDLSAGGMFLHVYSEIPQGAAVKVSFTLPGHKPNLDSVPVYMSGRVVRVESHFPNGKFGIGVAFDLDAAANSAAL